MNFGVIINPNTTNLGDDIQTYAATRFFKNPLYIDRENLDKVHEKVKVIMNGWFMSQTKNWPPSSSIDSLFISFHGNNKIINKELYSYYKKFEPIGCRDLDTLELFNSIGIDAYYSGCLTLTLPEMKNPRTDEIIVVDLLRSNYSDEYRNYIKNNLIPKKFENQISYISHLISEPQTSTFSERMKNVELLLDRYSRAKLVVTSLIHCALPCLAIGTPVLFVDIGFSNRGNRRSRFDGILDLMNVYSDKQIPFSSHSRIDKIARMLKIYKLGLFRNWEMPDSLLELPSSNSSEYKKIAEQLASRVNSFIV